MPAKRVAVADGSPLTEQAHYFEHDAKSPEVLRCIAIIDGQAVVNGSSGARLVSADTLSPVPTTAGDVRRMLGAVRDAVNGDIEGDADIVKGIAGRTLTAVQLWIADSPGIPDSEK